MEFVVAQDRIYANDADGRMIAEITFPTENNVSTIDHTFVDESLRGQGIAGKLVQLAVNKILADGKNIAATCPYAVLWLQRHPEYSVSDCGAPVACRINKGTRKK